ncbi:MAG: hypothetical protein RLZZ200_2878 [Pseudomonadota bacterium]|jgi:uncharacterized protein YcfJ
MDRSLIIGVIAGVVIAGAGGAMAAYKPWSTRPHYAEVVDVKPLRETRTESREECRDVPVTVRDTPRDGHRIAGTAIGAVVGGVLGHQVGGGRGRDLATVAGAAAGGYAGNRVQKEYQDRRSHTEMHRDCRLVDVPQSVVVGYEVTYRFKGETGTLRMDRRPGERILVKDGQWVPPAEEGARARG